MAEAVRVVTAAETVGVALRVTGGVGVALSCRSARREPLARGYQDIDFVTRSGDVDGVTAVFAGLGYLPEEEFNALHSHHRLFFRDPVHRREADVFIDRIEACHDLDLRARLGRPGPALAVTDLLLSKLQVVETNEKDYLDAIAIFTDHHLSEGESGIERDRLRDLCGNDWGWWRTVAEVAERTRAKASELGRDHDLGSASERIDELLAELEGMPKSRRWKLRARIGERKRWYELPEELEHPS